MKKTNLVVITLVAIAGVLLFFDSIINKVPTGKDAHASRVIYDEVLADSQKAGLPIGQNHMFESPQRGGTALIVKTALSEKEKQTLSGIVDKIGHQHPDRRITLKFQQD